MHMTRFGTMGKRILFIVSAVTLISVLTFGGVTLTTLSETARLNGQSQLETMLLQLKGGIEQEYQSLLQLSQHMMPSGPVGQIMSEYLQAQDYYEQGEAKRKLTKALSTNGGLGTQLMMYYDADSHRNVFSIFVPDDELFQRNRDETLYTNSYLSYQAIHRSYYRYSSRLIVSLSRPADFIDGVRHVIYVERISNAPGVIEEASDAQGVPYVLLQLDDEGVIRYSSDPKRFQPLTTPVFDAGNFGVYQDHYYARTRFVFGAQCLVLAPTAAYSGAMANWTRRAAVVAVLIALFVLFATWMLYRYVFRGLSVFKFEMDRTLSGDLESVSQMTGIEELDQLLEHFDRMKMNIKRIMREDAERERRQQHREREQLIYQINPHFLLNTLNSLHWLAKMNGQNDISRYVSNLSAILNYNLGRAKQQPTLRGELNILDLYLEIEQIRHDFHVERDIADGPHLDIKTPRLIFQPIVENAIGHGMDEGGKLSIRIAFDERDHYVYVEIADDGCGIDDQRLTEIEKGESDGVGLRYVYAVLKDYYGGRARFKIENRPTGGTLVRLALPCDNGGVGV